MEVDAGDEVKDGAAPFKPPFGVRRN